MYNLFLKKLQLKSYTFYIFILLVLSSFIITFILLLPNSQLVKDKSSILFLLSVDTILVILLLALIIRQIILILINRNKNYSASKLHIKFINLFTIISLAPTIGVIILTALFFNLELRTWFGSAVKSVIFNSNIIANEYIKYKQENLEINIESISKEIFDTAKNNLLTENELNNIINDYKELKKLEDIYIFNLDNNIIAYSGNDQNFKNFFLPSNIIKEQLNLGKIYITQNQVSTLSGYYKLPYLNDTFLLINDKINQNVYNHLLETSKAIIVYNNQENENSKLQISFSMIFVLFSTCLLLIAILFGFRMAGRLSQPITNLINSSEKVSKGDFNAKVSEVDEFDEISLLLKSFNKMVTEIEFQQKQLIEKNIEIEKRRVFTEAVLSSLSTGVIALNKDYQITLTNKSVSSIIKRNNELLIGENFFNIFKNLDSIKNKLEEKIYNNLNQQIEFIVDDNVRNLFITLVVEVNNENIIGYIVTIDDLTSLILAEKHAAWSGIARKIAHEIKNPLTPIKLSAERIYKKINEKNYDKKILMSLTKTISKQVDDIGMLIDEFSSFARLPKADIKNEDISIVIDECFNFYSNAHTNIKFNLLDNDKNLCYFDDFQISLVINNLTKNAIEAVEKIKNPYITFEIQKDKDFINIMIIDNGIGLNKDNITKIFEPYYTTKEKGTGLGLSICKKIMEDHNGKIKIKKNSTTGSTAIISLPL
tara:strand:+ start:125 stop:2254 length:2130 start_codon:yes stop_codon:yes gene_type:complete